MNKLDIYVWSSHPMSPGRLDRVFFQRYLNRQNKESAVLYYIDKTQSHLRHTKFHIQFSHAWCLLCTAHYLPQLTEQPQITHNGHINPAHVHRGKRKLYKHRLRQESSMRSYVEDIRIMKLNETFCFFDIFINIVEKCKIIFLRGLI